MAERKRRELAKANVKATPKLDALQEMVLDGVSNEQLAKASMAASFAVQGMFDGGLSMVNPKGTEDWIKIYTEHVWAYAGIYAIASTIARLPLQLRRREREPVPEGEGEPGTTRWGEWVEDTDNEVLDLLEAPNPDMTGYDLIEAMVVYLETAGRAYWEIVYETRETAVGDTPVASKQTPNELWPVRSSWLTPKPNKNGRGIEKYIFQTKSHARREFFPVDQIVPFRYFDPLNEWLGLSPLRPAKDDLQQDKQMAAWNLDFFQHGVTPQGLLSTDKMLSPKEMKDLGEQIRQFLSGKARKVLILSKGMQWQSVSVSPTDIDFLAGRKENRKAILAALGVPPVMVGELEHAKYDNYFLQLTNFGRNTILPKLKKIEGSLNNFLLPRFPAMADLSQDTQYALSFDTTALFEEDEATVVKRVIDQVGHGLLTPDEGRELMGRDPWPEETGGDSFYMDTRMVRVEGTGTAPENVEEEETEESLEARDDILAQQVAALEKRFTAELLRLKDDITAEVRKELADERDDEGGQ